MALEGLTELGGGGFREVIDTGGNGTLVGKETGDSALVLGAGSSDEGRVVQETVLGGVTLGLQGTEKSLLGTENLNSGGGVLGQVGQATGVGDKTGSDDLTDESGKVRGDNAHLGDQVRVERLAVLGELDNTLGERDDVLHVSLGDLLTHAVLGGINDVLGNTLIVLDESGNVVQALVVQVVLVLDEQSELGVTLVVGDNLDELGEVPGVPFADTHGESVDGLVKLVENGDGLDDVVVVTLDGELYLSAGVGVTKTELGSAHVTLAQLLEELGGVETDTTEKILDNLAGVTGLAVHERESGLDASSQSLIGHTEDDLLLLVGLGEVQIKEGYQKLGCDTLRDVVDLTKSLLVVPVDWLVDCEKIFHIGIEGVLKGQETGQLDHLAELGQVIDTGLDFLQAIADSITLVGDLEKRVTDRALEK